MSDLLTIVGFSTSLSLSHRICLVGPSDLYRYYCVRILQHISHSQTFNRLKVSASPTTSCFFQGNNNLSHSVFPSAPFLVLPMSHTLDVCSSLQLACMDFQSIRLAAYSMIFPYLARRLPLFCALFSAFHISQFYDTQRPHILQIYDIIGICDLYRPLNNNWSSHTQV